MNREPIAISETLKTIATSLVIWLVVMGYWPMTPEQQAVTLTLVVAIVNAVGGYLERRYSTPLSDPRDNEGRRLTPEGE